MSKFRTERDSMGELKVPAKALYGAQTQRAVENFPVSGLTMPREFIRALGLIKSAAAQANLTLGHLDKASAKAIRDAAGRVAAGEVDEHFPIDVFQTGSGTSSNMNANEVIAHLAAASGRQVHPNDHVNAGQSSNDVIPTAILVSATLATSEKLLPALKHLRKTIDGRGRELKKVVKTGRTHLMDAMPITFGQELSGWSAQIADAAERIGDTLKRTRRLPQGGSAVGTGINADPKFGPAVAAELTKLTGVKFESAENYFAGMAAQDAPVELSGQLRALAVAVMKIANDLRLMNSGPIAGLGEIVLPALQPGSSIMPGKINPVIAEATMMVAAQVIGNDATVAYAGAQGNFQLNVNLPVIARNVLESAKLLAAVSRLLADKVFAGMTVNAERAREYAEGSPAIVTPLNRYIGYEEAAAVAKQALKERRTIRDVVLARGYVEAGKLTVEQLDTALNVLRMARGH